MSDFILFDIIDFECKLLENLVIVCQYSIKLLQLTVAGENLFIE